MTGAKPGNRTIDMLGRLPEEIVPFTDVDLGDDLQASAYRRDLQRRQSSPRPGAGWVNHLSETQE